MPEIIHVMVGALSDARGRIVVSKRPDHVHQGGLWEFPGGKLESGESPAAGLKRELAEELGIQVRASRPLIRVHHDYGDRHVLLDVHRVDDYAGIPHGREGQPLDWLTPGDMDPAAFPAADRPIITALRLPTLMLITGEDPRQPEAFLARLRDALDAGVRLVQLRAHDLSASDYASLAQAAFELCERQGAQLLLNRDPAEVAHIARHGLHLASPTLMALATRPGRSNDLVGASCHDPRQLARAVELGLDYALLSPVKPTATHPEADPLGWRAFSDWVDPLPLPVYALGGLTADDLNEAVQHGAQGIAAIRGLWPAS
ncbi:Nudix family hydrolase [Allochromatium palmeri]|uniref:8-oxo-dGTP diphosphatase n=1 Tax=Allochromatium palmeri TaxID=231048 RepID=A0A6N8EA42_9GAMM|nr:Nudix family hydrolase [Allochromatium palmeri]MTW19496.1 Nudix family hydrolase [Allochromatium palmeri]